MSTLDTGSNLPDPWAALRRHTPARIGLGRAGDALPTTAALAFEAAHALARDAVHDTLDADTLADELGAALGSPTLVVDSAAPDRATYLQRPDLGRRLAASAYPMLAAAAAGGPYDLAFVVADGLSARAVHAHASATARAVADRLRPQGWSIAPPVLVRQGRVAVGDEIGQRLGAALVAVLIGERPGLSAPDSLGVYLTYDPRPGRRDSERNCVSNIRPPHGQQIDTAADTVAGLLSEARRRSLTGVALKDNRTLSP